MMMAIFIFGLLYSLIPLFCGLAYTGYAIEKSTKQLTFSIIWLILAFGLGLCLNFLSATYFAHN
jgi:hypothetical protein